MGKELEETKRYSKECVKMMIDGETVEEAVCLYVKFSGGRIEK